MNRTIVLTVTSSVRSLALGTQNSCALKTDGTVLCWGRGDEGGVGDQANVDRSTPAAVGGNLHFQSLTGSHGRTCGITTEGVLYCWGSNNNHGLGLGPLGTVPSFVSVPTKSADTVTTFRTVSSSQGGSLCALTSDGVRWCWGDNDNIELGNGLSVDITVLTLVAPPLFTMVAMGNWHGCALAAGGVPWCWGHNGDGAMGDGTTTHRSVPTPVAGSRLFAQIATGTVHSCGIASDGVYCWGANTRGILGDGTLTQRLVPTKVAGGF